MTRFVPLTIILSIPFITHAEPELLLASAEDMFFDDIPIVLSATRLAQPITEAPVAMTVIDREMIDASGARTIPDLLRLVPGFQVGYFDGNSPVATYHGHSGENSKRIQVNIDGRSVYVPSLSAIHWQDMVINIDDIDRIEVTRGPNASTYGNNSFFAVVSIFTRLAIEDQGHKVKVITGSKDTIDAYYRFGGQSDDLDYRISVGTNNDDGTDFLNDYTEADYLSYRLDYQIDVNNQLSYQGGFKDATKGDHEPPPEHDIEVAYAFQWIKWENQLSDNQSLSLQYYYNLHDQEESISTITVADIDLTGFGFPGVTLDGFSLENTLNIRSERHDIELNYHLESNDLRIVTGASARLDIVNANQVFDEEGTQKNYLYRAFGHGEYHATKDWIINAGFMIEDNDISGSDVSPRLSIIHHLNDKHTLRLGASKATRTPVLWEEFANYRLIQLLTQDGGQPLDTNIQNTLLGGTDILTNQFVISSGDLESEEIKSIELGYISQLLDDKLIIDVKIFKDRTDNLISEINDAFAPDDNFDVPFDPDETSPVADDWQNAFKSKIEGIETSFNYKVTKDFRIYGYYAYINIEATQFNPAADSRIVRRLNVSAPSDSYGLMLIKHWTNKLDTSISYFRVGEMDWTDRTGSSPGIFFSDRSAQDYNKLDIKISKTENFGKNKLYYAFVFQNLIEDFYDYNKTRYTDPSLTTIAPDGSIDSGGSLQDQRFYFELSYTFN